MKHRLLFGALAVCLSACTAQTEQQTSHNTSQDWVAAGTFTSGIEGPAVDAAGDLYAVNIERQGTIGRVTGQDDTEVFITLEDGSIANAIRFNRQGDMLLADYVNHNILKVSMADKTVSVYAHNDAMNQPNDIVLADNGTLYASDPNWAEGTGQLWRIDTDGSTHLLAANMGTTNGIELSPDGRTLYVNESVQRNVWRFDVSPAGELSNKQLFYRFDEFGMDGMSLDVDGNLYIARYGAGNIAVLSPAGKLLREVTLTGQHPTNITFGGPDGKRAFVTMQKRGAIETFINPLPGSDWQKQQAR
jgi:sugar lactone lactonase YvrE